MSPTPARGGRPASRRSGVPNRGDIYHVDPGASVGREWADRHYYLVVTPAVVNRLGVALCVVITTTGRLEREAGLAVHVSGGSVTGVALINHVRSLDLAGRVAAGTARFTEQAAENVIDEVAMRLASLIDPEPENA